MIRLKFSPPKRNSFSIISARRIRRSCVMPARRPASPAPRPVRHHAQHAARRRLSAGAEYVPFTFRLEHVRTPMRLSLAIFLVFFLEVRNGNDFSQPFERVFPALAGPQQPGASIPRARTRGRMQCGCRIWHRCLVSPRGLHVELPLALSLTRVSLGHRLLFF
jgi:hypothetical protein